MLREELSQFLSDNGIFRDMLWYVDLLQAQIYGDYINAQGGAYLKTDFSAECRSARAHAPHSRARPHRAPARARAVAIEVTRCRSTRSSG